MHSEARRETLLSLRQIERDTERQTVTERARETAKSETDTGRDAPCRQTLRSMERRINETDTNKKRNAGAYIKTPT